METLIDDLLEVAREGKEGYDLHAVEIGSVIEECWQTVMTAEATLHIESDALIRADRDRLAQVFENLIRNAIEHAGADVTVTIGLLEDGFYVEDDGPGIPEDERDAIFEMGHTSQAGGTGFGLSIVEQIVNAHGWEITVSDGASGGARFEINGVEIIDE